MSDTDEPVSLRSMIDVVEKQRNPGQRLKFSLLTLTILKDL